MLNFVIRNKSGFNSFKGVPENTQELQETVTYFLEKQIQFDGKKVSRQKVANLKKIFEGLEQTKDLANERRNKDLLAEEESKSKEMELYRASFKRENELLQEFDTLLGEVSVSSDRFIVKAKKVLTGAKSKAVLNLEKFLNDNNLAPADFDDHDVERLKRDDVSFGV